LTLPHWSALGGDRHGIGMNLERGEAEPLRMGVPRRAIGEDAILMLA